MSLSTTTLGNLLSTGLADFQSTRLIHVNDSMTGGQSLYRPVAAARVALWWTATS